MMISAYKYDMGLPVGWQPRHEGQHCNAKSVICPNRMEQQRRLQAGVTEPADHGIFVKADVIAPLAEIQHPGNIVFRKQPYPNGKTQFHPVLRYGPGRIELLPL